MTGTEVVIGELRPHHPSDLITKMTTVEYDPNAKAPRWLAFGYSLTGSTAEQVLVFLHGQGANGKSTALEAVQAVLGDYGRQAEPDLLLARDHAHPTGIADLQGARLVVSSEIEHGRRLAESTVKALTGDSRVKARFMRQDFFEFTATWKIVLAANHRPVIRGTDHAIWRRLRLVPFTVTIPDDQRDRHLPTRLKAELPGILAWAVEGCIRWRDHGLSQPVAVLEATAGYRDESDVIGTFLSEQCTQQPDVWVSAADIYGAYTKWCEDNGETARGLAEESLGPTASACPSATWLGVGLLGPLDPLDPSFGMNAHAHARDGEYGKGSRRVQGSKHQQLRAEFQ